MSSMPGSDDIDSSALSGSLSASCEKLFKAYASIEDSSIDVKAKLGSDSTSTEASDYLQRALGCLQLATAPTLGFYGEHTWSLDELEEKLEQPKFAKRVVKGGLHLMSFFAQLIEDASQETLRLAADVTTSKPNFQAEGLLRKSKSELRVLVENASTYKRNCQKYASHSTVLYCLKDSLRELIVTDVLHHAPELFSDSPVQPETLAHLLVREIKEMSAFLIGPDGELDSIDASIVARCGAVIRFPIFEGLGKTVTLGNASQIDPHMMEHICQWYANPDSYGEQSFLHRALHAINESTRLSIELAQIAQGCADSCKERSQQAETASALTGSLANMLLRTRVAMV